MIKNYLLKLITAIMLLMIHSISYASIQFHGNISPSIGNVNDMTSYINIASIKLRNSKREKSYTYGFQIAINSVLATLNYDSYTKLNSRSFLFLENDLGIIQVGNNFGGHYLSQADNFKNISSALIPMEFIMDNPNDIAQKNYIYSGGLWTDQLHLQHKDSEKSRSSYKITYISPIDADLMTAISFIPDTSESIQLYNNKNNINTPVFSNVIQISSIYKKNIGELALKTSVGFEYGSSKDINIQNLRSFDIAGQISYMGLDLGCSYGNIADSTQYINNTKDSTYQNYGISYTALGYSFLTNYFQSFNKAGNVKRYTFIASHHISKNIYLSAEYSNIKLTNNIASNDNIKNINIFLVGSKVIF